MPLVDHYIVKWLDPAGRFVASECFGTEQAAVDRATKTFGKRYVMNGKIIAAFDGDFQTFPEAKRIRGKEMDRPKSNIPKSRIEKGKWSFEKVNL